MKIIYSMDLHEDRLIINLMSLIKSPSEKQNSTPKTKQNTRKILTM